MKRIIALVLCLALILQVVICAFADDDFDLSYFREKSNIYDISADPDGYAFIDAENFIKIGQKSFEHKYEHPSKYSYFSTDLFVHDYFKTNPQPVLRLWINYCGTKHIYANSATFTLGEKDYTFSGIALSEKMTEDDEGVTETLLIKFDTSHLSFLGAFLEEAKGAIEAVKNDDGFSIPVVLHGSENLDISMNSYAVLDFIAVFSGLSEAHGLNYLKETNGSKMKVTDHK